MSVLLNKRTLNVSLYVFYGIVVALCLLYYRFPYDLAAQRLIDDMGRDMNLRVKLGSLVPLIPPVAFRVETIDFEEKNDQQNGVNLLRIQQLQVKPYVLSLLRGVPAGNISGLVYGGILTGSIAPEGDTGKRMSITTAVKSLRLHDWKTAEELWGTSLAGIAQATLNYTGDPRRWTQGSGEAEVKVTDGSVTGLSNLMIPLDKIDQCSLDAKVSMSGGNVTITECLLESRQGKAQVAGALHLAPDVAQSRLDLTLNVSIDPTLKREMRIPMENIRFSVKGTAERPMMKFLGGR